MTRKPKTKIEFTVLGHPTPQGSTKGFLVKGKVHITSANAQMKPWRQQIGWTALNARAKAGYSDIFAGKHVPVRARFLFYLAPPQTMPKGRTQPAVKPDLDKLCRSTFDALSGILWLDDAQVVDLSARKDYDLPERAEISVEVLSFE
jgi:Holliday junction resolvase RusA-like endonuclease